ncbi:MAG: helix-turn-helix domain-containing protein [Chitinophagaceae bacterium]|nr:helix-turn-helix domain-containing protein [Chitinophagaceae bacterium]
MTLIENLLQKLEKIESLLSQQETEKSKSHSESGENLKQIGGIDFACNLTNLPKSTIYYLSSKREIPCFKKGKRLYFSRIELEKWLTSAPVLTIQEASKNVRAIRMNRKMTKSA